MLKFHHMSKVILMFALLSILGGSNAPLIKNGLTDFSPNTLVFLRFGLATLILLPFVFKEKVHFRENSFRLLLISSAAMGANVILFAIGLQNTSIMMSQLFYIPKGLFVGLFGYLFLKEALSKNQKLGLFLTMVGISILIYGSIKTQDVLSFGKPIGNLLIFIGILFSTSYYIISRKISKYYSPLTITFFCFLVSTILSFPFALYEYLNGEVISITFPSILNLLALAVFSSISVYYLVQWLIKHASAYIAALALYMNFLIASSIGIIAFGEKLTLSFIIAACLIVFGVYISTKKQDETIY